MKNKQDYSFAMEERLYRLDKQLHRRFTDVAFVLQRILLQYKRLFPEFTDHSSLHSMSVIDFSNRLIGSQIDRLNADELYVLLMSCYLHDSGMDISEKDYEEFKDRIDFGNWFDTHPRDNLPAFIRAFHHEFSGQFIRKYAELLEIPSPEHEWAIVQVARGHRRTDLMNEQEYPTDWRMPNGNTVCLPYLAALIRLADEIDVSTERNPELLYSIETYTDPKDIQWFKTTRAIRSLQVTEDEFTLQVDTAEAVTLEHIRSVADKMQETLDYCRSVVLGRTTYIISQKKVSIGTADRGTPGE